MSSFVGHGLAALTIGKAFEENEGFQRKILWQSCLVLCAFAPDVDYLVPALSFPYNHGLRITHSIAFSLILPVILTCLWLLFERKSAAWKGLQAGLAGLSHLLLDFLVGSGRTDPLLYPFYNETLNLPFGILPSAGALRLTNFYFYRNLLIELGILLPVFICILVLLGKLKINKLTAVGLLCMFVTFLVWSVNLNR